MKKKNNVLENILILMLIVVCSWQNVFLKVSNYFDDLLIILVILVGILKKYTQKSLKFNIKDLCVILFFFGATIFNVVIKKYEIRAYIEEIYNYFKYIIALESIKMLDIDSKDYKKFINLFIWVNVISCIYGIFYFHNYDEIGYTVGDKFRNGKFRIKGLTAHPISLAFAALFVIIYSIENFNKTNNKVIAYLWILVSGYALILTQTRLAMGCLVLFIFIKMCQRFMIGNILVHYKKFLKVILIIGLIALLIIIMNFEKILNYLENDLKNTVRMFSLKMATEIFLEYPILGTGIGTFNCDASIKYNSYVYQEFNFKRFEKKLFDEGNGGFFESYLSKVVIETGLIGILFQIYYLSNCYKNAIKSKNIVLWYNVICICIYLLINSSYQIPYLIGVSLIMAFEKSKNKSVEMEEKKIC